MPTCIATSHPSVQAIVKGLRRLGGRLLRSWQSRLDGRIVRVNGPQGLAFNWISNSRYPEAMSRGDYEHDFARALLRVLRPGDTFFDVGANAGYFSLLAKLRVGTGTVVAFEPLPENIRMIRAVEAVNPNVTFDLVEGAVGAYDGEISFEVTKNNANGRLTGVTWVLAKPAIQQVVVRCVHLLPFLQKYRPAVVKLDTEGAEFTILSSLGSPSEWKGLPIFLIEFHGQENTDRCSGVLRNWGYQLFPAASCSETREIPDQYVMAVPSTRGEN